MKKYLLTGLLIWVPILITIWVLVAVLSVVDKLLLLLPDALQPANWLGRDIPGLGLVLAFLVLLCTGMLYANFLGAWVFNASDSLLSRIPLLKVVYTSVKQLSDTLLNVKGRAFKESVLVPYPHPGVWALGFVSGTPPAQLVGQFSEPMVTVYVPTAPSPASGAVVIVPRSVLRPSGMTVQEALKYIVSLGVVSPNGPVQ